MHMEANEKRVVVTYPPPRIFGIARIPLNASINIILVRLNVGWMLTLNPPYPYKRHGLFGFGPKSYKHSF